MTRYEKLAVSLPSRVAEGARRAVRVGRAPSLSAYVADAVEQRSTREELAALFDTMLAETGGPLTAAETKAADRALGITKRRPAKRRPAKRTR